MTAFTVSLLGVSAATFTAHGLNHPASSAAVLNVFQCVAAVIAGVAFLVRWRITGEAPVALCGIALVVGWLPQIPLMMVDASGFDDELVGHMRVPARVCVTLVWLWFLLRAVRAPEVDSGLRPLRSVAIVSTATAIVAVSLDSARLSGVIPTVDPTTAGAVDCALAALTLVVAWTFWHLAASIPSSFSSRFAVGLSVLALSYGTSAFARQGWTHLWVLSGVLALAALVVLAVIAMTTLKSVLEFNNTRLLGLRLRADSAEKTLRDDRERMHELRATLAGVRNASATLHQNGQIEAAHRRRLEEMLVAELARLERLLSTDDGTPPGPLALDDVIEPLVLCQRELGATVHWEPSGACVVGGADRVAEVLNVLLTNARLHAPGAAVEVSVREDDELVRVVVRDHGPGLEPGMADDAFRRGTCGPGSNGSGLGLYIARRIAVGQGGDLELVESTRGSGAAFVLTLTAVPGNDGGSDDDTRSLEETG